MFRRAAHKHVYVSLHIITALIILDRHINDSLIDIDVVVINRQYMYSTSYVCDIYIPYH